MPKFNNQNCIHCLKYFEDLTRDHVFPESWYPDSTPANLEKWVAPACVDCNGKLGKIEEGLYFKIGINTDKSNPAALGVADNALRKIDVRQASDEASFKRKSSELKKIKKEFVITPDLPGPIMKNFGPSKPAGEYRSIFIPNEMLDGFMGKLVRGLEYKLNGRLVTPDRVINSAILIEQVDCSDEINKLKKIIEENGKRVERGPGFVVEYAHDKFGTVLYHVLIWGKLEIWADVANKKES